MAAKRKRQRPRYDLSAEAPLTHDPVRLENVEVWGGRLVADLEILHELCQRLVGVDWVAASPHVYFDLGFIGKGDERWSFFCIRMLVCEKATGELRAVVTHAFVDNAPALTRGREIFGFPALLATFDVEGDTVSITTEVLPATPGAATEGRVIHLTKGLRTDDTPPHSPWLWHDLTRNGRAAAVSLDGELSVVMALVQLKHARDAIDPTRACFSDLVRGVVMVQPASQAQAIAREITLTVTEFRNFTMARDLGIRRTSGVKVSGYELGQLSLRLEVEGKQIEAASSASGGTFGFRPCDPLFAPDYRFKDVETTAFRLPVPYARLKRLCDVMLNDPFPDRGYKFVPANVELVLELLDYGAMISDHPPPGITDSDTSKQRELVFRMLVGRIDDGNPVARSPAVFTPFVFVDSASSLISGREVAGYPKEFAEFKVIPDPGVSKERQVLICQATTQAYSRDVNGFRSVALMMIDCRERRNHPASAVLTDPELQREAMSWFAPTPLQRMNYAWWSVADLVSGREDADHFVQPWVRGFDLGYAFVQVKSFTNAKPPRQFARYYEQLDGDYILEKISVAFPSHRASLHFQQGAVDTGLLDKLGLSKHVVVPAGCWYRSNSNFRLRILDPLR